MPQPAHAVDADREGRPGLTSLVRTGRGLMTLQTELVGQPAELVTIVDFRGRVLKTWRSPFRVDATSADAPDRVRAWHGDVERRLRVKLAALAQRRHDTDEAGVVAAHLFVAAMRVYGERDFVSAAELLDACAQLIPDDPRVGAAHARVRSLAARG